MTSKKVRIAVRSFLVLFLLVNILVTIQAYNFTHFSTANIQKTARPESLNLWQKANVLFTGVKIPKPKIDSIPKSDFTTEYLQGEEQLEVWNISTPKPKGTVILFHGYTASKSKLIAYAEEFHTMGFRTILLDFRGSGGSSGHTCTIGYREADDVKLAYEHYSELYPDEPIILFGVSMGSVGIMRAIAHHEVQPSKLILECPFGTMQETVETRFDAMGVPSFPLVQLIMMHAGLQLGFNSFAHRPVDYAKAIDQPTLLLYGAKDQRVSLGEINRIYTNLNGPKQFHSFSESEHEIHLNKHPEEWKQVIKTFLQEY